MKLIYRITCNFSEEDNYSRVEEALWFYRDIGRPFHTHHQLASSREHVPFPINAVTWFTFYVMLSDLIMFLRREQFSERPTLYIHASVICPFSVIHHAMFRYQMYDFFLFNTPSELYACIHRIRFRLFFMSTTAVPRQEIFVENLRYQTNYSDPMYFDLAMEQ